MNPFSDIISRWGGFYGLAGAASATLAGLLFVAVSLHVDLIATESAVEARALARQTLSNFIYVVLISLVLLVPNAVPLSVGLPLFFFGLVGGIRELQVALQIRQRVGQPGKGVPASYFILRLILPGISFLTLFVVSLSLLAGQTDGLYWMVAVIGIILVNATMNSWNLLIRLAMLKQKT